jgi:AcrR family transcriptional regulator
VKRDEVVDAAFRAWGTTPLESRGLEHVAEELGVTKAAIYRVFDSKEALTEAMLARTVEELRARCRAVYGQATDEGPKDPDAGDRRVELIARYVQVLFDFFTERPEEFGFMVRGLVQSADERRRIAALADTRSDPLLTGLLRRAPAESPPEVLDTTAHFVRFSALFWTLRLIRTHCGEASLRFAGPFDAAQRSAYRQAARRIAVSGLRLRPAVSDERMAILFERCRLHAEELPPQDERILEIERVMHEMGVDGASISRIAEALGMSRSSLYHYYPSRDALVSRIVEEEHRRFSHAVGLRIAEADTLPERVWAFMVATASYLDARPELQTVMHWVLQHGADTRLHSGAERELLTALQRAGLSREEGEDRSARGHGARLGVAEDDSDRPEGDDLLSDSVLVTFPYFLVVREMGTHLGSPSELRVRLSALYRLVAEGISGARERWRPDSDSCKATTKE